MRDGAVLINTARAEVLDNEALVELVKSRRIRVGTDVYAGEPESKTGEFNDELGGLEGVYGTHHIGASTDQAQTEIALAAVSIVPGWYSRSIFSERGKWVRRQRSSLEGCFQT